MKMEPTKLYVHDICGQKLPVAMKGKPIECIEIERSLIHREGDVFIVTFPKTGTTVLQYMCHLLRTHCKPEYQNFEDIHQMCPHTSSAWFVGQDLNTDHVAIPRLFKSHRELCQVAPFAAKGHVKFIATIRDPMTTLVSVFSFGKKRKSDPENLELIEYAFSKKWTEQYNEGCISTIFDYYVTYYKCLHACNFLLIPYEDLIHDKTKWLQLIATFMDVETSSDILDMISQMTTKESMLMDIHKFDESWCKRQRDLLDRAHPFIGDTAAKVTDGQEHIELLNKTSKKDKNTVQELHQELWRVKVQPVTGMHSYDELRQYVNEFYFPPQAGSDH